MAKNLDIDGAALNKSLEIIGGIAGFQPYSSISFLASDRILEAVEEAYRLVDWGMAKNKKKMKATALEIMEKITEASPGEPVNLNLDEYELSSMAAAADLIERTLDDRKDGVSLLNMPDDQPE